MIEELWEAARKLFFQPFGWYAPKEFLTILNEVKNHTITHLLIDDDLLDKFGRYYYQNTISYYLSKLAKEIQSNTSLVSVELKGYCLPLPSDFFQMVSANPSIHTLILNGSISRGKIQPLKELARLLCTNWKLKKLHIYVSDTIDAKELLEVIHSLKKNKKLEILELNRLDLLSDKIQQALSQVPTYNNTLRSLAIYERPVRLPIKVDSKPSIELVNPSYLQSIVKLMHDKKKNTFFKFLPKEIKQRIAGELSKQNLEDISLHLKKL